MTRRFLYITRNQVSAYAWRGRQMAFEADFAANDDGLSRFAAYLHANKGSCFRILANLRDEAQEVTVIPYLRGKDRQALIARKLDQHFLSTALTSAFSLGYEATRRKDERVLLSALTRPADLEPWLAALATAEAPLAGIYSLSQLGGLLVKKMGSLPERCLLLSRQDETIRESFIVDGTAVFSRLVPASGSAPPEFAGEAARLHQYLAGQNQVDREKPLPAFILGHPLGTVPVQAAPLASHAPPCTLLDHRALARKLGLASPPADDRNERLFLHLLATDPPRQQFAPAERRFHYRLVQSQRGLFGITAAWVLIALSFAGKGFHDHGAYRDEAVRLSAQAQALARQQEQISASQPQLAISHASLQQVRARLIEWQSSRGRLAESYHWLGRALDQSAAIELDAIDWKLTSGTSEDASIRAESMAIEGNVIGQEGSTPRQVLADFNGFLQILKREPWLEITIRRMPFDTATGQDDGAPQAFALQISRRPSSP